MFSIWQICFHWSAVIWILLFDDFFFLLAKKRLFFFHLSLFFSKSLCFSYKGWRRNEKRAKYKQTLIDDEMKSLKIFLWTFPFKYINKKSYFVFTEIKNSYTYVAIPSALVQFWQKLGSLWKRERLFHILWLQRRFNYIYVCYSFTMLI